MENNASEHQAPQAHILVVDDDQEIRELLSRFLTDYNYRVTSVGHGRDLPEIFTKDAPDLILLDLMLPDVDGFELCKTIRKQSSSPIIMMTAVYEDIMDRVVGLEIGADDYIIKPFNPRELLARIKAVLRRSGDDNGDTNTDNAKTTHAILAFAGWRLDKTTRRLLSPDSIEMEVSSGEYDLLLALLEHPQRVLTRDFLLDITRHRNGDPFDRSVDVLISRLRQKLEDEPKSPKIIKTVRNAGYMLAANVVKETQHASEA